jgi:hypothetical protein
MPNQSLGGFRYKRSFSGATGPTILLCNVAATGDLNILGVMDGVERYWDGENMRKGRYLPASTAYSTVLERTSVIRVISAADAVFEADADDGVTAITEATFRSYIGENCDITATAGSTTTGQSGHCLDISTHAATTAQFRILSIASYAAGQDFTSSRVKLDVKVHESHLAAAGV